MQNLQTILAICDAKSGFVSCIWSVKSAVCRKDSGVIKKLCLACRVTCYQYPSATWTRCVCRHAKTMRPIGCSVGDCSCRLELTCSWMKRLWRTASWIHRVRSWVRRTVLCTYITALKKYLSGVLICPDFVNFLVGVFILISAKPF